jgi:hypothetical protein
MFYNYKSKLFIEHAGPSRSRHQIKGKLHLHACFHVMPLAYVYSPLKEVVQCGPQV